MNLDLATPIISIDSTTNSASWNAIENASYYEVVIDNGLPIMTTNLSVELLKGSHISVRAVNQITSSKWSLPKANYNVVIVDKPEEDVSVYFTGFDSYMVSPGTEVNAPAEPTKTDYTFGGWSLEMNGPAVSFPYTVTENTVFYAIWTYKYDYTTRVYYNLVDGSNNYVKGLTWNYDNYSFYEYESGEVTLKKGVTYYIQSVDNPSEKYGPYTVSSSGIYKLYFSDEHVWDDGRNIYIAEVTKTIYFTNNKGWTDTICIYMWNKTDGVNSYGWPGIVMEYDSTNDYGQAVYKVTVNLSKYDHIIFSHGTFYGDYYETSSQTIDLKLSNYTNNGFYVTEKNSEGKYNIGTWKK